MGTYITDVDSVKVEKVSMEGAKGSYIQWLIDESKGARNFAMRRFTIKPGGTIPIHSHWYEHEIYVLKGGGILGAGNKEYRVKEGNVIFVPPHIKHWYRNDGNEDWVFLCMIPIRKCE